MQLFWYALILSLIMVTLYLVKHNNKKQGMFKKKSIEKKTPSFVYFPPIWRTEFETHDNLKRYLCEPADENVRKVGQLKSLFIHASSIAEYNQAYLLRFSAWRKEGFKEILWPRGF